ncbi:MAG: hypothetical protein K2J10_10290, partial [Muribaculaceae bacterium]|nr:hypothetical protein [Muribaculaceae bacterium]
MSYKHIENSNKRFFIHFLDDYHGDKYTASGTYSFYLKGKSDSIDGRFTMTKLVENDSILWSSYLGNRFSNDWPRDYNFQTGRNMFKGENPIKVKNVVFKNLKLENCIIFN